MSILLALALIQTAPSAGIPPTYGGLPCERNCPVPSVPDADTVTTGPRPLFTAGQIVTVADYPEEAIRQGFGGMTVTRLSISRRGKVDACAITRSSGFAILDQATCALLIRRARFAPARNARKKRVASSATQAINWHIVD